MSTSSARPDISIVIGSNGAAGSVERILATLAPLVEGGEVVVCEPHATDPEVEARYPFARFLVREGALVPELWRDGIAASSGEVVCLTLSVMRPRGDWVSTARALSLAWDGAGGAIEPGHDLRLRDWAEYFARYAPDMLPFGERVTADLPGDNACYTRASLERAGHTFRDGFWEPDVNRELARLGAPLVHTPLLVVEQGRSAGFRAFVRQRLVHGRAYGRQRGARFGRGRNAVGVVLAPAVPFLLLARTAREVLGRRRHRLRLLGATPLLVMYGGAWALGEAAGHLDSLRRR